MSSLGIFDKETKTYKKVADLSKTAVIDSVMSDTSTNAVQNKVVKSYVDGRTSSVEWNNVSGKPSTYPPSSHTHTKSQITDFPSSLPANGGNSATVNGHTVNSNVPANAKFTDAVYDDSSLSSKVTQNTKDISALKTADNVLSSRIDAFTSLTQGSTTGDAELIDIRIGADGTPYNNAGSAVRGQINTLRSEILQTYEIASVDEINNYLGIEVV